MRENASLFSVVVLLNIAGCGGDDSSMGTLDATSDGSSSSTDASSGTAETEGEATGDAWQDVLEPVHCFPNCAADFDDATPLLDPVCFLAEEVDGTRTEFPECGFNPDTAEFEIPPGVSVCFVLRFDESAQTPAVEDDLSSECLDGGYNLEFGFVRDQPLPAGAKYVAQCETEAPGPCE